MPLPQALIPTFPWHRTPHPAQELRKPGVAEPRPVLRRPAVPQPDTTGQLERRAALRREQPRQEQHPDAAPEGWDPLARVHPQTDHSEELGTPLDLAVAAQDGVYAGVLPPDECQGVTARDRNVQVVAVVAWDSGKDRGQDAQG